MWEPSDSTNLISFFMLPKRNSYLSMFMNIQSNNLEGQVSLIRSPKYWQLTNLFLHLKKGKKIGAGWFLNWVAPK